MAQSLLHCIALTLLPRVGDIAAKKLIAHCGSAEAVFEAKKSHLLKIPGMGEITASAISKHTSFARAEKEMSFLFKNNIQAFSYWDAGYPNRLKNCQDAPVVLYTKGNGDLNAERMISIVGTRTPSDYGKKVGPALVHELQKYQATIVSGLAYGVDIMAHKSSLQYELPTFAVLAHGLDRIYPAVHKSLAQSMLEKGGWITDFMSETNPDKENFPKRNRIIAGLSDAVIVIEAGKKGGALITAEIANSYNRDVMAVPGKLKDPFSEGCNYLIKTHKAALIETAEDIANLLNWQKQSSKKQNQPKLFFDLNPEEEILLKSFQFKQKLAADELMVLSNLPMSKVSSALLNLEFNGVVKSLPGKIYQLN